MYVKLFDKNKYINVKYDYNNAIASALNVNITPTVLLFDDSCRLLYKGAIDNKDITTEKSKHSYSISYIDRAINSYLNHEKIDIPCTTPIGCIFR